MKFFLRLFFGFFLLLSSLTAFSGELPFSQKTFDDLRAAGKPVVVYVHADWCPVCKKQGPLVSTLEGQPQFKELTVLSANFDTEKALLKSLNVAHQSTFVAFKGNLEVGRSTGDTNQDSIAALFLKTL